VEGTEPLAYLDSEKKMTVGIGFNMDRGQEARDEWDEAFKNEEHPPDFEAVKAGHKRITHAQIKRLFDDAVEKRGEDLKGIYGSRWDKLRPQRASCNCQRVLHGLKNR
jgi:hypothetical protein